MSTSFHHRDVMATTWRGGARITCACGTESRGSSYAKAFSKHLKHRQEAEDAD